MNTKTEFSTGENRDIQFLHLTQLLSLLIDTERSFTIEEICVAMDISIFQTRQYILDLLSIKELSLWIFEIASTPQKKTGKYVRKGFPPSKKEIWSKQLLTGYFDKHIFRLDPTVLYIKNALPLWLTPIEYSQLASKYPDLFNNAVNTLRIKKDISSLPEAIKKRAFEIQSAILNNLEIEFYYNGIHLTGIFPQLLYHDTDQNIIYCVDNEQNYYRLDRIDSASKHRFFSKNNTDIITLGKSSKLPLTDDARKKCDYMWGMADSKEEPIQVCVKIYHDTQNLLNKIKDETRLRKYAQIEEHDGFSYYYDTIIGINNFRSWLRSYGSSLIVLEPKFLAEQMTESARKIIDMYS